MNLTENEIRGLPLEQKQKLVLELKGIQPGDKAYPNAKAIIELITNDRKYKDPTPIKVKALDNVTVDGREVKKDQETEIYPWQYHALSRAFELLDEEFARELGDAAARNKKKRDGDMAQAKEAQNDQFSLIIGRLDKIAELLGKKVALIALVCGLALSAQAQYTPMIVGGLNGGTNFIAATSGVNALATSTTTTTIITNPVVTISNGTPVFSVSYMTNTVTTTPGLVNLTHYDGFGLEVSFALTGAGTTAVPVPLSQSVDGINFWPLGSFSVTAAGTTQVTGGTNVNLWYPGYLLVGNITNANGTAMTNVTVLVSKKGTRAGP